MKKFVRALYRVAEFPHVLLSCTSRARASQRATYIFSPAYGGATRSERERHREIAGEEEEVVEEEEEKKKR